MGKAGFEEAGRRIAYLVDQNPDTYELLLKENPDLTADFIMLLEDVGRGTMPIGVIMIKDEVVQNIIMRLPADQRALALTVPQPVLKGQNVEQIMVQKMTRADGLRWNGQSVEEQAKRQRDRDAYRHARKENRYFVDGDEVVFMELVRVKICELKEFADKLVLESKDKGLKSLQNDIQKNQIAK